MLSFLRRDQKKEGESRYFEASINEENSNIVITTDQQNTTDFFLARC